MPLLKGKSNKTISKNIKTILSEKGKNTNQKQAVAIALSTAKVKKIDNKSTDKKMEKAKNHEKIETHKFKKIEKKTNKKS